MTKRSYSQRLKGKYKILGDYVDDAAIEGKSIFEFFRILATCIVPLIKKSPAFEVFVKRWTAERAAHDDEYKKCESKVPDEVESAFKSIKADLQKEGLIKHTDIKERVKSIGDILKKRRSSGMPTYIEDAHEKICDLLSQLLLLGRSDIVQKYAKIGSTIQNVHIDAQTGERREKEITYLGEILFSPNYYHLKDLLRKWYEPQAWVSWDKLVLLEHAWSTPASFFQKHSPKHPSYEALNRKDDTNSARYAAANMSNRVLGFGVHRYEVSLIKKREYQGVVLYKREIFFQHLELLLNEIILGQESQGGKMETEPDLDLASESERLKLIGLRVDGMVVVVKVKWDGSGADWERTVDDFDSKSEPYLFIKALCDAPIREHVDSKSVSKASVAKLFSRIKLGPLEGLFFERVKGSKTHKVYMKSRTVDCSTLDHDVKLELIQFIKTLKPSESSYS